MGREVGGYTFLAKDREPEGMAFYGGRAGRLKPSLRMHEKS